MNLRIVKKENRKTLLKCKGGKVIMGRRFLKVTIIENIVSHVEM